MNILIVDDEALARSRLRTLLGDCRDTLPVPQQRLTVAEASNAAEALALLGPTGGRGFDLILLDIHMPGQDGLAMSHAVRALPQPPAIVFVTAHAEHAVSAFELDAVDYLTKPVRRERLLQAIAKVQRTTRAPAPPSATSLPESETLLIQDRGRTERLPVAEVLYFKAEQKYVTVRTATRSYIMDGALSDLETRFAPRFLRIHRNALVARRAVRALERHYDAEEGEGWAVRLQGSTELLTVSRRQVAAVREELAR
ncbi:LytR/AlgR family response regulator transcription factor [Acidovorax sp.]|uniref:LytR/AlgR family response regulator transcription factor n=1 Tax=Acidovorax sp. TaxID=1872122 RepID=UPI00391FAFB3